MQARLIAKTELSIDVMYVACRTCYSNLTSGKIWETIHDEDKMKKLILKVLGSGHFSIAEHINFTFVLDGISRACANQLVRHRHCSFSQQSLRYVEIKEDYEALIGMMYVDNLDNEMYKICDKYFVNPYDKDKQNQLYHSFTEYSIETLTSYLALIRDGAEPEDARGILGLNFKTNMVVTMNLREFIHICNERLCMRAQTEIREIVQQMVNNVLFHKDFQFLKQFFKAKCKTCTEADKCTK